MDPLLVISDEAALAETLASELTECSISEARFKEATSALQKGTFALILADPGYDDALAQKLATEKTPVIRLTRPLRLADLLYTIRTRLQSKSAPLREEVMMAKGFKLSPGEKLLSSADGAVRIALTEKEVELLLCLLEEGGKPMARDKLLMRVWGYSDDIATHTLETHIYRLRGKLRQADQSFDIAFSETGGYRLATS